MANKKILFVLAFFWPLNLVFCAHFPPQYRCQQLNSLAIPKPVAQIIVVQPIGTFKARLSTCTKQNNQWYPILLKQPIAAVIGQQGLAPLGTKKEGDGKTPAGLYPINWTFATKPLALHMDFRFITDEDKFIDDPKDKHYNQWINGPTSATSYEAMMNPEYEYGAVVNYNMNPIVPGAGSAIFIHRWRSEHQGTAGCIALNAHRLLSLLHWLDKRKHPYIYIVAP